VWTKIIQSNVIWLQIQANLASALLWNRDNTSLKEKKVGSFLRQTTLKCYSFQKILKILIISKSKQKMVILWSVQKKKSYLFRWANFQKVTWWKKQFKRNTNTTRLKKTICHWSFQNLWILQQKKACWWKWNKNSKRRKSWSEASFP